MEVHPPHHAIGSWREFFVHMATIVLGLLIALGLEQVAEGLHNRHLRHELQENMRAEAERNVKILTTHLDVNLPELVWYRSTLKVVTAAVPKGGFVDVTLPPPPEDVSNAMMVAPERNVWPVALTSGAMALLPETTAQMYSRVDFQAAEDEKEVDRMRAASALLERFSLASGYKVRPGTVMHLSLAQRDELVAALAVEAQQLFALLRRDDIYMIQCQGVLAGFDTVEELMDWGAKQPMRVNAYRE
jgi:hypothetical protein